MGAGALAVIAVAVFFFRNGLPDIRHTVTAAGLWAPLLFVLLHGAVAVTPIPRTVFTVAAGVLFGSVTGVVLAVTGTALAATMAFWLVRLLGGGFVERRFGHRPAVVWVRARLDRSGLLAMVSLRLIPAVPFFLMNYASALAGVRFLPYLVGTVLGVLPGTIGIVVLGDAAVGGTPHPAMLLISLTGGLVGLTGALIAARRPPIEAPQVDAPDGPEPETGKAA
ncbi:TVP38/TMEM64 family protein [Pseudonocardia aurantiaca]